MSISFLFQDYTASFVYKEFEQKPNIQKKSGLNFNQYVETGSTEQPKFDTLIPMNVL